MSRVIAPMKPSAVQRVRTLEAELGALPQVEIPTEHTLHAGAYTRTILIPAGVALTGALIQVDTVLIISGDVEVFIGGKTIRMTGYNVLQASAGRKQAFLALADTHVTMVFATQAQSVPQAEEEFTNEADRLLSRRQPTMQEVLPCPEP